ncbi:MAG TPA: RNase H family protein, partial [Patescibacteria group bacterium]
DSQISLFNLGKHHSLVKVNREIFQNIAEVIDKHNLQIKWVKVLGHSGEPNNDRVDKLANDLARSK